MMISLITLAKVQKKKKKLTYRRSCICILGRPIFLYSVISSGCSELKLMRNIPKSNLHQFWTQSINLLYTRNLIYEKVSLFTFMDITPKRLTIFLKIHLFSKHHNVVKLLFFLKRCLNEFWEFKVNSI